MPLDIFFWLKNTSKWRYCVNNTWQAHLNFAIRYEGVNLEILKSFFKNLEESEIIEEIKSKPSGGYCHKIWFLYEFLLDKTLPIPNVSSGNFVKLLDDGNFFRFRGNIGRGGIIPRDRGFLSPNWILFWNYKICFFNHSAMNLSYTS